MLLIDARDQTDAILFKIIVFQHKIVVKYFPLPINFCLMIWHFFKSCLFTSLFTSYYLLKVRHNLKNLGNVVKNYDHRGREERESLSKNVWSAVCRSKSV
jgi:hypothetical protein